MNLIVAVDSKWGIGRDNGLLASIPGDLKNFKAVTTGKAVIMGRRTLESMPGGRGLPNRVNYVLTSNRSFEAERCMIIHSEQEMMNVLEKHDPDEVFLIGGASLYNKYYRLCDKLYITKMEGDLNADTFIKNIDEDPDYEIVSESEPMTENGVTYRFLIYERK